MSLDILGFREEMVWWLNCWDSSDMDVEVENRREASLEAGSQQGVEVLEEVGEMSSSMWMGS